MGWYDARMTKDEIESLGKLSRIALTEAEKESFTGEIDAILAYVSKVKSMAADESSVPKVGSVANVLRDDVVTNVSGNNTEVLTGAFPVRSENYLVVKKILSNDK